MTSHVRWPCWAALLHRPLLSSTRRTRSARSASRSSSFAGAACSSARVPPKKRVDPLPAVPRGKPGRPEARTRSAAFRQGTSLCILSARDAGLPSAPTNVRSDEGHRLLSRWKISSDGKSLYATGQLQHPPVRRSGRRAAFALATDLGARWVQPRWLRHDIRWLQPQCGRAPAGRAASQWDVGADGKLAPKTPASVPTGSTLRQGNRCQPRQSQPLRGQTACSPLNESLSPTSARAAPSTAKNARHGPSRRLPVGHCDRADGRVGLTSGVAGGTMVALYDIDAAGRLTPKSTSRGWPLLPGRMTLSCLLSVDAFTRPRSFRRT